MTLQEAIEILETAPILHVDDIYPRERTALELAVESLKKYKGDKETGCIRSDYFLPGETEE